jgi:hypothetical protein
MMVVMYVAVGKARVYESTIADGWTIVESTSAASKGAVSACFRVIIARG